MPTENADERDPGGAEADAAPNPLSGMLAQVQAIQAEMAAAQQDLEDTLVEASAGGGLVTARVSGSGELRSVTIAPEVVDPGDVEMLEDLVTAAVREAQREAGALARDRFGSTKSGIDLGGLAEGLDLGGLVG